MLIFLNILLCFRKQLQKDNAVKCVACAQGSLEQEDFKEKEDLM